MNSKTNILYLRLSDADGDVQESNLISNQRRILSEYAERNGLTPYEFVVGDGTQGRTSIAGAGRN